MARGRASDRDVEKLRQAISSFGFTVVARGSRIFVLWVGAEELYICKKLPRQGYWELSKVDRDLWELHGAIGLPVFEYISIQEIMKWFYDLALMTPAIMEGLKLVADDVANLEKHANRLKARGRPRDLKHEYTLAKKRKRNKRLQEAEERDRKRQDDIRDRISQTGRQETGTTKRQSRRQPQDSRGRTSDR